LKGPTRHIRLAIALAASSIACSQIAGIEDAHFDPMLAGGSGGTQIEDDAGSGASAGTESGAAGTSTAGTGGSMPDAGVGGTAANSGGTTGAGAAGDAPLGTGGSSGSVNLCERYCDAVMSNCKGRYEQYRNFKQCVEVCRKMPAGTPGDQKVNTVECRIRQAGFAESEPFVYCKSCGPLGAGECGSNCVSYCELMKTTCTSESTAGNSLPSYFETTEACLGACSAIAPSASAPTDYSTSAAADPVSFAGNHVFCRTYHVVNAITESAPDEHCPHAMGADPCVD
jgi:hypothetical protein